MRQITKMIVSPRTTAPSLWKMPPLLLVWHTFKPHSPVSVVLTRTAPPLTQGKRMAHPPVAIPSKETAYSAAVDMAMYESQLFWAIMGVFLLAQTILAGFLLTAKTSDSPALLRIAGASLGVVISWLWVVALARSAGYHKLRIYQARELERDLHYDLFIRAENFAAGKSVVVDSQCLQQPWFARNPTIKQVGILLAVLFGILFMLMLLIQIGVKISVGVA